jgi:NTE family protein
MTQPGTALVFAGGGSLGAIQVGMVKALVAHGVEVDLLVGASVGAINAAFLAHHGVDAVGELEAVWRRVRRRDVFPVGMLRGLLGLVSARDSLVAPDALKSLLLRELGEVRIEAGRRPLFVVATDMRNGAEVVLSRGAAIPALMASAAIPGVFPPVSIDGRLLIDGGVANNTPISTAVGIGATRIIVLPTGSPCSCMHFPSGALFVAIHALNITIAHQLAIEAERFAPKHEIVVVPPLCPLSASAYTFGATRDLITRAESRTRRWLDGGGLDSAVIPPVSTPHGDDCPCS